MRLASTLRRLVRALRANAQSPMWPIFAARALALATGALRPRRTRTVRPLAPAASLPGGISVVIPSRNGRELLAAQMDGIHHELAPLAHEVIVVDNGSSDGTVEWLATAWPAVLVEHSPAPLTVARAMNRGIDRAHYSHICLLNNDMLLAPGFFTALASAFQQVPNLFSATAQIFFPPGVRREETGKTVFAQPCPEDFPIRCQDPLPGEDHSPVLYGSGGCTLYDARRLRALGGVDICYEPAYVEDLDLGYRAWQQGWPSVYVAGAQVEHRHRATTSRYYTPEELDRVLETNYLRFLARAVADPDVFSRLWRQAIERLALLARVSPSAAAALRAAPSLALNSPPPLAPLRPEAATLALCGGQVAVFPGRAATGRPRKRIVLDQMALPSEKIARDFDTILIARAEPGTVPPPELLATYSEITLVTGTEDTWQAVLDFTPEAAAAEPGQVVAFPPTR